MAILIKKKMKHVSYVKIESSLFKANTIAYITFRQKLLLDSCSITCSSDGFTNLESTNPDFFFHEYECCYLHLQYIKVNKVTKPRGFQNS